MTAEFEQSGENQADRLFSQWKETFGFPESFPAPVPTNHPNANELLFNRDLASEYSFGRRRIPYCGIGNVKEALERGASTSGYSFMILPSGQGASTLAEAVDVNSALSVTAPTYVPVFINSDFMEYSEVASREELRERVLEEILKRAVLAQRDEAVYEEIEGVGRASTGKRVKREFIVNEIVDDDSEVDLELAMKVFGGAEGIIKGLSEYFQEFRIGIDFSSPQHRKDPAKYGVQVARVFNAVKDVVGNLRESGLTKGGGIQGFGPTEALDAITEVSGNEFSIGDQGEITIFNAWRMILGSYPDKRDDIARYIHSGLLGKAVASGEQLPIAEIFKRFEENLKAELLNDPNSLHLGFK